MKYRHHLYYSLQVFLLSFASAGLPSVSCAADWDVGQLMQLLASKQSSRANFVETKYIAMLDKPVMSSGELFYTAPDHLEKSTLKPKPETMILDQDTLLIKRGNKKYNLQLQEYPELVAFVESIRGTLAGDRAALERNYTLRLEGSETQWVLQLLPSNEQMKKIARHITITGELAELKSIEIVQADGDRSVMAITKLAEQ